MWELDCVVLGTYQQDVKFELGFMTLKNKIFPMLFLSFISFVHDTKHKTYNQNEEGK